MAIFPIPPPVAISRIGEWRVLPASNEMTRNGETDRLEPKAMEVLMFLAERAGQVVSREALLEAIWPGAVVGDDALTQAVIKLRKSFGDASRAPRYIETISKRGYRLIAPIERLPIESRDAAQQKAPDQPVQTRRGLSRPPVLIAIVVALVSVSVAGIAIHTPGPDTKPASGEPGGIKELDIRWTSLPTIMVAPFETVAADGTESYLARGIASDLTTDLSRLGGLRVISFPRHGLPDHAGEPIARYSLSGTVQRNPDALRINVWLVDNISKAQLWAERYDRPFSDLMAVQEDIISHLLQALPVRVSEAELQRLARRYTRNLEAYDFFLRGKAAYLVRQPADNQLARELYQKAIELDPGFARAYAGLALTHADDYRNQWYPEGAQSLAKALQFAESALKMDPDIADLYAVLGYIHAMRLDYGEAVKLLTKAVDLDRSYADAYAYLGAFHAHMGQPARTIPLLRTAMRLNPDAGFVYFVILGRAYLFQGDIEQAMINLKEAVNRNAGDLEARVYMAATLVAAGDLHSAMWEAEEIRALQPGFTAQQWLSTYPMTDARQKQHLRTLLARLSL